MPDYDPLTISDEALKALPPAERGAVYKARAAAKAGGAAPAPGAPAARGGAAPVPPPAAPAAATPTAAPAPAPAAPAAVAAPAKPAPPKEPEKPAQPPFVQTVLELIPGSTWQWRHGYAEMKVPREALLEAAQTLRDQGFDYLSFITEVDWRDHYELIYHLYSYNYQAQPLGAILRCDLPRDNMPEVASVTAVWPGAEFMEREAFEMLGIRFLGHPDLRRILLPDDFVGFPMRRDFVTDFDYITVKQLVHESD
ncbi:MAG TPA: NADH-quinone oxidoreductase subunit C [Chloroflexota bacterium]|nr:NADH-quinone oxidoreductase subunit C [Chloroflexota bacterium]